MKTFEHQIAELPVSGVTSQELDVLEEYLNREGRAGWELVQIRRGLVYFKRELGSSPENAAEPNYEDPTWLTWAREEVGVVVDDLRSWLKELI